MEALSKMLNASMLQGLLSGFSMGIRNNKALMVNHLLFAGDTLVFCGAQAEHVRNLRCTFLCFEAVSGLRINLGKSELVPIGEGEDVESLAHILGCRIGSPQMTYLGMLLEAPFKSISIWNEVIEKVERRLASWKKLYLSKGGRVTLIHNTLSIIPTYYLSLFPIPVSVAKKLERLQMEFLWSGMGDETKLHLVNWHQVCTQSRLVDWEFAMLLILIKPYWGNGFRGFLRSAMLCEDRWLRWSMEVWGEVGVHYWRRGLMVSVFGSLFEGGGIMLPSICILMWVMGLIFAFGMMFGVGIGLSSSIIQLCTLLRVLLMLGGG